MVWETYSTSNGPHFPSPGTNIRKKVLPNPKYRSLSFISFKTGGQGHSEGKRLITQLNIYLIKSVFLHFLVHSVVKVDSDTFGPTLYCCTV